MSSQRQPFTRKFLAAIEAQPKRTLCDVQDRIEHLQVRQADVASLPRRAVFDLGKLRCGDLDSRSVKAIPLQRNLC